MNEKITASQVLRSCADYKSIICYNMIIWKPLFSLLSFSFTWVPWW